jgi:hypothetical protein
MQSASAMVKSSQNMMWRDAWSRVRRTVAANIVLAASLTPALAVEGALGRTIPGLWIQPQGAVVGPHSGFNFTTFPIGYMGSIGGGRLVPIGGSIFANVEANISSNWLVPSYVYKTEIPKLKLSSTFIGPLNWEEITGSLQFNDVGVSRSRTTAGIGDVAFAPLTAGIELGKNNHLAIGTLIFAPTGYFRRANLTNVGMGEWTFMPNVAHTYLWEKRGLEFDNFVGFDVYTKNNETNYTSGTMFHWDGMVIQYLSKRVGFGVIGSKLKQITDDTGPTAKLLHGFEGHAWGVGPMALYVAKVEKPGVVLQLRWINEFEVSNLMKGNAFMFGLTFKLN